MTQEPKVIGSLPERVGGLGEADARQWLDLAAWHAHGFDRQGTRPSSNSASIPILELTIAGPPAWPAVPVFNGIDTDLVGRVTGARAAGA
jgi:hypothetical protein